MAESSSLPAFVRWRALSHAVLHWRVLEDQYVVYNDGSGHTHVLDPIATLLIQELTEEWCETGELVWRIRALLNVELTEELGLKLQQTLWQLDELGLLESVIP
jgi:PqqD family protein of HPr-rel-A system